MKYFLLILVCPRTGLKYIKLKLDSAAGASNEFMQSTMLNFKVFGEYLILTLIQGKHNKINSRLVELDSASTIKTLE